MVSIDVSLMKILFIILKTGESSVRCICPKAEVGMLGLAGGYVLARISACWWATDRRLICAFG